MRELLVTITLLSLVSSEEPEPKKRLELPPEVDPNFWPVRGRRSYWDVGSPSFFNDVIEEENDRLDGISGRETDYSGYTSSSETSLYQPSPNDEIVLDNGGELRAYFDARRDGIRCYKKRSISVVLPLGEGGRASFCNGHCGLRKLLRGVGVLRGDDDLSWRQRPFYVEEPGWIAIDYNRGFVKPRNMNDDENEDPFIVARGKKWRYIDDKELSRSLDTESRLKNFDQYNKYDFKFGKELRRRNRRDVFIDDNYVREIDDKISRVDNNNHSNNDDDYEKSGIYLNDGDIEIKKKKDNKLGGNKGLKSSTTSSSTSSTSTSSSSTSSSSSRGFLSDYYETPSKISPQRRDKHSNLQGILDEPFFISRGKKDAVENNKYLHSNDREKIFLDNDLPIKNYDFILPRKKPLETNDILKIYRGREENSELHYLLDNENNIDPVYENKFQKGYEIPQRNRRGMLDDIFNSDDPFYVARGKRLFNPRKSTIKIHPPNGVKNFNHFKNPIDRNDKKLSIYEKILTQRTKLMKSRQLSSDIVQKNNDNNNNNIYDYLHNSNEGKNYRLNNFN